MRKISLFILFLISLVAGAQKQSKPDEFAKTITADDLKKHLYIVTGKDMEGRETATDGQKKAAAYIENHFRSLGLLPGNNGSYQMTYPVYQDSLLTTAVEINGKAYQPDQDYSINIGQSNNSTFHFSEVLFVGNGIADSLHDDYKGLDVRGKVLLMLGVAEIVLVIPN